MLKRIKSYWNNLKKWIYSERGLLIMSIFLVLFNMIDGGLSWYLILYLGVGYEANPLMAMIMDQGVGWFFFYKFLVIPMLVYFLYRTRKHEWSMAGIISGFFLFLGLMIYFAISIASLLYLGIL